MLNATFLGDFQTLWIFCLAHRKIKTFLVLFLVNCAAGKGYAILIKATTKSGRWRRPLPKNVPRIDRIDLRSSNCTTTSLSHKVILWVVLQNKNDFFLLFLFSHFFTTVQYCRVVTLQKKAPHEKCKTLKLGTSLWGPPNRGCIFSLIEWLTLAMSYALFKSMKRETSFS